MTDKDRIAQLREIIDLLVSQIQSRNLYNDRLTAILTKLWVLDATETPPKRIRNGAKPTVVVVEEAVVKPPVGRPRRRR